MVATTGIFAKLWNLISSPIGYVTANMLESGSKKVGEKITEKVGKMFEIGEKSLGDEILCDNALEGMDPAIVDSFEEFMGWLEEQQPDGKKRAEKIREIIAQKIKTKTETTKKNSGKKGDDADKSDKPVETTEVIHDYTVAQGFIIRMMSRGDHGAILQWLKKKNFFSTIGLKTESRVELAAKRVGNTIKTEAQEGSIAAKSALDDLADWLDSK